MPDFSLRGGGGRNEQGGAATGDSGMTDITDGGANTKGSYVEMIASTAFHAGLIEIFAMDAAPIEWLIDVAVGAAASEQDVISNLHFTGQDMPFHCIFPLSIAAGSRISMRGQSLDGSQTCEAMVRIFGNTLENAAPLGRVTTYGANTADSGGVQIDPGASANTKGSYSQITASTTNPIRMLGMALGNQGNIARVDADQLIDIAVGAATSEQIIFDDIYVRQDAQKDSFWPQFSGLWPVNIPSGSRLAVRAQSTITDATDRLFDAVLYGLD